MKTLTQEQVDRIVQVIQNDCYARYTYSSPEGTCVVGGLAIAAGLPLPPNNRMGIYSSRNFSATLRIAKNYGLTQDNLCALQAINDWYTDVKLRRKNLVERVQSWLSN